MGSIIFSALIYFFVLCILLIFIVSFVWSLWNTNTKGKKQLETVKYYLEKLENNPTKPLFYRKFIDIYEKSDWLQITEIYYKPNCIYKRLITLFANHPENELACEIIIKTFNKHGLPLLEEEKQKVKITLLETILSILALPDNNLLIFNNILELINHKCMLQIKYSDGKIIYKRNGIYHKVVSIFGNKYEDETTCDILAIIIGELDPILKIKVSLDDEESKIFFDYLANKIEFILDSELEYEEPSYRVYRNIIVVITKFEGLKPEQTFRIYNTSLLTIENYPDSSVAKQFALTVGRWHYSNSRPDKMLTTYDEQAIQNDIIVRSK